MPKSIRLSRTGFPSVHSFQRHPVNAYNRSIAEECDRSADDWCTSGGHVRDP